MDQESLKYWIALRAVEEVGCVGFRTLLQAFSSPREVFSAAAHTLRVIPGIGPKTADHIRAFSDWGMAEREIERARELGVAIVTCGDAIYPRNLLNIYDYPPLLYVQGSLRPEEVCVAVVGSRLASVYGRYTTEKISRELALQGITVVSGLARGIDAAAHRGALAGKGRTIAVLGCGLDIVYPPENEGLAGAVAAHGALVTEFPFGTPPNAPNFPSRNRIISGISLGVVVVEAGEKSGSLITARIAAEQGRSVFAVPGEIGAAGSRGTHRLIKQGARLVENIEDILEEILPQAGVAPSASNEPSLFSRMNAPESDPEKATAPARAEIAGLGNQEQRMLSLISARPVDIDTLITSSGLTAQEVLNALLVLELRGLIRQLPGKQFLRKESSN
ncbi:MAG: DNA-processing protein DprA [Deltaproteobacteria bacterium]|nr:DNA-processing protein DprA [Deltaproteobacteria bacterium]